MIDYFFDIYRNDTDSYKCAKAQEYSDCAIDAIALLKEQDSLLKEYRNTIKDGYEALTNATKIIKSEPQIVRCKDCKHWEKSNGHCPFNSIFTNDDWFCADGERK